MQTKNPSPILLCTLVLGCIAGPCHAEPPSCSLEVVALQDNGSPAPNGLLVIVVSGERRFSRTIGLHGAGGAPWHTGLGRARLENSVPGHVTLLTHPLGWIDVTVLDREGQPADWAGARVQALVAAGATATGNVLPIRMDKGRTRYVVRQGSYRLTLMPERWFIAARIDGKPALRPVAVEVATEPVNVTFTVRRPGILRGRIEDAAGIAIPWVNVNALRPGPLPPSYRGIGQTVGGIDGTFELHVDRLPVEIVVTDENRMFEPAYRLVRNHEDPLLFVGHPIRTDLRLEGRLVDQQSGEPLAPASVTLFTHCDEIDLPAALQYRSFMQATVEVPRAGVVTITVRNASGEPVPALRLRGFSSSPTTDGNGRFEVPWVEAGAHPISIDRLFVSADQAELVLVSDNETATHGREAVAVMEKPGDALHLSLTAVLGGVLCLEPVDAQGNGLPITAIEVQHDNGIPVAYATVPWQPRKGNRDRLCTRPLQAGAYRVQARGPGFIRSWWPGKREAADAISIHLDALLPGWVGAGQQELVWEIRPAETRGQVAWTRHSPDYSGCRTRPGMFRGINCRLTDLPIGTWHVRTYRPGSDPAQMAWRSVEPVSVRRGRVTQVGFEPAEAGGTR